MLTSNYEANEHEVDGELTNGRLDLPLPEMWSFLKDVTFGLVR